MIERAFGVKDDSGRRKATDRMIRRASEMMAEGLSPDEYMARHGRNILIWSGSSNVYPDPEMHAWVSRAAEVWNNADLPAATGERFLTGAELEQARLEREQLDDRSRVRHQRLHKNRRPLRRRGE